MCEYLAGGAEDLDFLCTPIDVPDWDEWVKSYGEIEDEATRRKVSADTRENVRDIFYECGKSIFFTNG
jgi:hypothetical protein